MSLFYAAVEVIYQAAADPAQWPAALQAIADNFGDFGAVMIFGKANGDFGVVASPSIVPMTKEYQREWAHCDVRAIRGRKLGYFINSDVLTDRHILTEAEMDQEPHYKDFLAKYGLRYFAAISVSPAPHVEAALSVQRRSNREPYSDAEMLELSRLSSHVERALGLGIRLLDADVTREGLLAALDKIGHGVITLDDDGRIHHCNDEARSRFGHGLRDRSGTLWLDDTTANEKLRTQIATARELADGPALPAIVVTRHDGPALVIRLLPIVRASHFLAKARFVALVSVASEGGVIQPGILRDAYALTHAEARLAAIVGTGRSPSDAASALGITEQTVRSVLKRIFDKTGVSRQGELVHLFARFLEKT